MREGDREADERVAVAGGDRLGAVDDGGCDGVVAGGAPAPDDASGGKSTFADLLPYSIGVAWGETLQGSSDRGDAIATAQPARNGELRLRIGTANGGGLLTAGNYADTITIRFEPAS